MAHHQHGTTAACRATVPLGHLPCKAKDQYNKLAEKKMLDLLISLAFSMQSNKGAYALLLDAGVSRSSRIPTG